MSDSPTTFDAEKVLEQLGDDVNLLQEISDLFTEDAPLMLADIEAAVELNDAHALANSAHALKGAVANFAAHQPRKLAEELEKLGRRGSTAGADTGLETLQRSVQLFQTELAGFLADRK